MDALEFFKARERMCRSFENSCRHCPLAYCVAGGNCKEYTVIEYETVIAIVEQWAKEHPQKTIVDDFFEKYPNAPKNDYGTPLFCLNAIGFKNRKDESLNCNKECESCWSQPLEE